MNHYCLIPWLESVVIVLPVGALSKLVEKVIGYQVSTLAKVILSSHFCKSCAADHTEPAQGGLSVLGKA
jgi:hypothetical protein